MDINTLWHSGEEKHWQRALEKCFQNPAVIRNLDLEKRIGSIEPSEVKSMSALEFYRFLYDEYFVWKYTAKNRLATTRKSLMRYGAEGMDELGTIKDSIFDLYEKSPDDTISMLEMAIRIKGLGVAGASGLLSILFPEHYGTVDQFAVYALRKIQNLPGHDKLEK